MENEKLISVQQGCTILTKNIGKGTLEDPVYRIDEVYDKEGNLLFINDKRCTYTSERLVTWFTIYDAEEMAKSHQKKNEK